MGAQLGAVKDVAMRLRNEMGREVEKLNRMRPRGVPRRASSDVASTAPVASFRLLRL